MAFFVVKKIFPFEQIAEIEIKTMTNVGIPKDIAEGWVIKALHDLKAQGAKMVV